MTDAISTLEGLIGLLSDAKATKALLKQLRDEHAGLEEARAALARKRDDFDEQTRKTLAEFAKDNERFDAQYAETVAERRAVEALRTEIAEILEAAGIFEMAEVVRVGVGPMTRRNEAYRTIPQLLRDRLNVPSMPPGCIAPAALCDTDTIDPGFKLETAGTGATLTQSQPGRGRPN
jgi:hypothetical protein